MNPGSNPPSSGPPRPLGPPTSRPMGPPGVPHQGGALPRPSVMGGLMTNGPGLVRPGMGGVGGPPTRPPGAGPLTPMGIVRPVASGVAPMRPVGPPMPVKQGTIQVRNPGKSEP